jgi:hypothetical protein
VAAPRARAVRRLSHALPLRSTAESCPSTIGLITLDRKQAGERSAGNPHATFDEAGNGNQLTVRLLRHSQRKRRETARHTYGEWRHPSTLLLGGTVETAASFEARYALRPTRLPDNPSAPPITLVITQCNSRIGRQYLIANMLACALRPRKS